jgi:hypothetical protein
MPSTETASLSRAGLIVATTTAELAILTSTAAAKTAVGARAIT